jgi:hypothetical protein
MEKRRGHWAFFHLSIPGARRLHRWIHNERPLGMNWPGGICWLLNRLGRPLCIEPWQLK